MNKNFEQILKNHTDNYFLKTKKIVEGNGDIQVVYAVFLRRPGIVAVNLAIDWLNEIAKKRKFKIKIIRPIKEGEWFGAGDPILFIKGPFSKLADLETLYLQKIGPTCIAAANAFQMCFDLPKTSFIAMDARHCSGEQMSTMMAYGASVGSKSAQKKSAKGFIGTSIQNCSHFFNTKSAIGTMPHALVGYAGSTLNAVKLFHDKFPNEDIVILPDYFGKEISDTLEVCEHFSELANKGKILVRLDTPNGRFIEGLNTSSSYEILDKNVPKAIKEYRSDEELKYLVGPGVSAAAVWHLRTMLDKYKLKKVKIIGSSGFNNDKCKAFAKSKAPLDLIGTGSYLPEKWSETYATADIVQYGKQKRVKVSREYLLKKYKEL